MLYTKFEIGAGPPIAEEDQGPFGPTAELVPFEPELLKSQQVAGRRIEEVSFNLGTYGMGTPAFFGLRLGTDWLVVAIWGASAWIVAEDRHIWNSHYLRNGSPRPWVCDDDEFSARVIGHTIATVEVLKTSMELVLDDGFVIRIDADPATRPVHAGSLELRAFKPDDDLRKSVFLCPTDDLWV